jgi:hypothetical protein
MDVHVPKLLSSSNKTGCPVIQPGRKLEKLLSWTGINFNYCENYLNTPE